MPTLLRRQRRETVCYVHRHFAQRHRLARDRRCHIGLHLRHRHDLTNEPLHPGHILLQPESIGRSQSVEFDHQDRQRRPQFMRDVGSKRLALPRRIVEARQKVIECACKWLCLERKFIEVHAKTTVGPRHRIHAGCGRAKRVERRPDDPPHREKHRHHKQEERQNDMFSDFEPFAAPADRAGLLLEHEFYVKADKNDQREPAEQAGPCKPPRQATRHGMRRSNPRTPSANSPFRGR